MTALALPAGAATAGPSAAHPGRDNGAAVLAAGLVRRYGEGDTAVEGGANWRRGR